MSTSISEYLRTDKLAPQLAPEEAGLMAGELGVLSGLEVYPGSLAAIDNTLFFLGRKERTKQLGLVADESVLSYLFSGTSEKIVVGGLELTLTLCDLTHHNAAALRRVFSFLNAVPLGLKKSGGCGDRLGLATPGHIRAIRNSTMAPILAQQSIRENARTGRTPQEVMDDATWGIFQEGWRGGYGADADHLKNTDDIDVCAAAGFTFYTIDPGAYVDGEADTASLEVLRKKVEALPWVDLKTSWEELQTALATSAIDLGTFKTVITEEALLRAAAKYGTVVRHTVNMYRHLEKVMGERPFELEMSVDETDTVTSLAEHIYIAHELKRLGVKWVSLAPRYVGTFEKGVDYIGDLGEFERSFSEHLAVSKTYGPYKLSLHSGSDKFSVYPIASRVAGELVHLKTAGTSYLEAWRAVAQVNPALCRQMIEFAKSRYETDRVSYHVSAEVSKMPPLESVSDAELIALFDEFNTREVIHVTFGSVLHNPELREPFFNTLKDNEEVHYRTLETHFNRHFSPFAGAIGAGD